ncbi:kinesin-like protein KIF3A [Diabrotica virgifera virgifera]|uniref:Kinesin-like protein n=1 Tax=Diabrotica virgifera virgifera TaxID=50390 RepID=A0A6P7FST4_DIAVI|nr:kinesin-like protein KIF3A [Diabrotica virgifera virgifera]
MLEVKDSSPDTVENVRVFIRIRPLKDKEKSLEIQKTLHSDNNTISLNKNGLLKTFTFCKVFDENSQQIDLYRHVSVPIVEQVLKGYNGTIFAYGQSGTGKTYTMVGDITDNNRKGIVPNIFSHIFAQITLANHEYSYAVTVTYLEIYNEEIRDLLSDQPKKLTLKEKPGIGVYVKDLLGFTVDSLEGVTEILKKGNKNRATSFTQLNDVSSRSHAVFTVLIETKNHTTNKTTFGKLNLVDLAGSERVHKSLATGDRLREAGKINLSLSVLGNVISALVDGKATHIPYRNSKLTRLLQDSLGGNSLTAMIAMVSPRAQDCEETLYTLMYADRVKHIQNHVTANVEAKSVIETFESKIAELREQLMLLEAREEKLEKKEKKRTKSAVHNNELEDIESEKSTLQNKINIIQKKILVGGENLVEKAQQQMELLEHVDKELQHLDTSHSILKEILLHKEKEKTIVKKEYADLKEEDKALDSKLEEVDKLISKAVEILKAKENEYQNEICTLLYNNKSLAKETSLAQFVIKESIPKEYLSDLKSSIIWDENTQEWQVKGIAYCGNNLRRTVSRGEVKKKNPDSVYLSYPKRSKLKPRN